MTAVRDALRRISLSLPEATEKEAFGSPTWRVRDKIFVMERVDGERPAMWLKAPEGAQEVLTGADPDRFYRPPYVGHKGWIGMRLDDDPDWDEVAALILRSYRMTAPKRLLKTMETG